MSEWHDLVSRYLAGELSPSERKMLEASLKENRARRKEFAEILLVENDLRAATTSFGSPVPASDSGTKKGKAAPATLRRHTDSTIASVGDPRSKWRSFMGLAVAVSIAVVSTVVVLSVLQREPPVVADETRVESTDEVGRSASTPQAVDRVAAYLGRTEQCVWAAPELHEGAALTERSHVKLVSGKADLIFDKGALVTLQGPCELIVDDAQAFSLRTGDASVFVPDSAFGFKVVMPSGIVVDLGTEFGVSVDEQGSSEVHVFQGQVAFQALSAGGDHHKKPVYVFADRAYRYSIGGIALHEFQANEQKFNWRTRKPLPDERVPNLPVRDGLALWLAADTHVDVDENNRVKRWRDLLVADNTSAEDALQLEPKYRPLLTKDGINGAPSVRFGESGTFLLTPPLSTTNEQTAFVVCSLSDSLPRFQQVLNYNGPPQRVVGPLGGFVSPAVFEICLRDGDHDGLFAVCGEIFSGFKDGRQKVVKGVVKVPNRMKPNAPVVVGFRYSLKSEQMTLFLNGRQKTSQRGAFPIAITSRKILGRHPIIDSEEGKFQGDLGEVLIYNRALTNQEVELISSYLAERFRLKP